MDRIFVIDASGYLYRAYFAIPGMTNPKGESTNALFGFIRSIQKLIKDFQPTHIVSVFDGPNNAKSRLEIYPQYKAHRETMPPDLRYQIGWAHTFCDLMGISKLSVEGVEADDTMGSVAVWASTHGGHAYLCTSDKDMCQLVNDKVSILNTHKDNTILGPKEIEENFGVPPSKITDYLAILGDSSDNVPGISGFGGKTAADLIQKFGSLEYILEHPTEVSGKKKQETLVAEADIARMSKKLVIVDTAIEIPHHPDYYVKRDAQAAEIKEFYTQMGFHSLLREFEASATSKEPVPEEKTYYTLANDDTTFHDVLQQLSKEPEIGFSVVSTNQRPLQSEMVGISFSVEPLKAWYIPLNGELKDPLKKLKELFENPHVGFYAHEAKYFAHILSLVGIKIANVSFDTTLASYVLNSHSRQHSLEALILDNFGKVKTHLVDLIGKGKSEISIKDVSLDKVSAYACEEADYTLRLKTLLSNQLKERQLEKVYFEIELPLMTVLTEMEEKGIFLDSQVLITFGKEVNIHLQDLARDIYGLVGEEFNLNSPKQMGMILTEKLGLKLPKTQTGYSTSADVLEGLKDSHPVMEKILSYRTLEKLRSTYIETLPSEVNPRDARIHCTFNQSVAATGRLSCQDPNLQNIPVRGEEGRKIREAFRPQNEGWSFVAADYSQIELRLLAHLSGDETLIQAFNNNEDIHAFTASAMLNIPIEEITKEQRYSAKAVNFGIIYGQQAFGLSQELGIDVKEAAKFIETYFQRYPKVKEFLELCKDRARMTGKAVTLLGRERLIPEIHSKNIMIRNAAERLAVNTPFQGMAADLIKLAMLKIAKTLKDNPKKGYMILQIHDELIFEVPNEEIPEFKKLVTEAMEEVYPLKVPLVVDISIGKNWKEC